MARCLRGGVPAQQAVRKAQDWMLVSCGYIAKEKAKSGQDSLPIQCKPSLILKLAWLYVLRETFVLLVLVTWNIHADPY